MSASGIFQRLRFLKRPQGLLVLALLLGCGAWAAVHGWAWYHFSAGQASLVRYQNDAALAHFQQSLRIWPRSPALHWLAARAERRAGRFDEAQQHLDQCRQHAQPDLKEAAAFEWALLRAAMGDLRSVEESLQSRILSRPEDAPLIWEALAEGYRRNYRMPEALRCLDTWLHFEPENLQAYFLRGEVHRQVGAVNRARDEYHRVVELDTGHDAARGHLARCLVQVGRYQEAAQHLDLLLLKSPDDPGLRILLARSQYDLGQREAALRILDEVLRDHPQHGAALRERGRLALAAEDFSAAEEWYRQALTELPADYEVRFGLHRALQGLGKSEEAKAQLAKAQQLKNAFERIHEIQTHQMTLRPFDPALHAELGEMLVQTGQLATGEQWLLSALHLDPNLTAAHAALARFYDEQGNPSQAELHRQEVERLGGS